MKKIYRSKSQRMLSGVCGGIAHYFNIDPTIVRLVWVLVSLFSTAIPGLIIYLICVIVIPDEPDSIDTTGYYYDDSNSGK